MRTVMTADVVGRARFVSVSSRLEDMLWLNRTGNTDGGLDFVLLKHSQVDIY